MSAFLVSNETINRVVHLLDRQSCGRRKNGHLIGEAANVLGQQLWELNAQAVGCRYGHAPEQLEQYAWHGRSYTRIQLIKAAQCWRYQCAEGEQFMMHELYKRVEQKLHGMMGSLIAGMKEYEETPWDAPQNAYCPK